MSDAIDPALDAEEWRVRRFEPLSEPALSVHDDGDGIEFVTHDDSGRMTGKYKIEYWSPDDHAGVIALLNSGLPDTDPRKITREWVREIRGAARDYALPDGFLHSGDVLNRIADALESYLPPEAP